MSLKEKIESARKSAPTDWLTEGMTNGDVIKAMFPKAEYEVFEDFLERHVRMRFSDFYTAHFDWYWWNAPYNAQANKESE